MFLLFFGVLEALAFLHLRSDFLSRKASPDMLSVVPLSEMAIGGAREIGEYQGECKGRCWENIMGIPGDY